MTKKNAKSFAAILNTKHNANDKMQFVLKKLFFFCYQAAEKGQNFRILLLFIWVVKKRISISLL